MRTVATMRMPRGYMSNHRFRSAAGAIALALCVLAVPASAAEIEGVEFRDRLEVGDVELSLNNTALLRYRIVFRGYVAGLYLGDRVDPDSLLDDVPKRLEIEYFWGIPSHKFAEVTVAGISANRSLEEVERLRPSIDAFNALYQDIQPGDRYALTYLPGVGTQLARNGASLGTVEGADFAAAIFSIWFGAAPVDESLKLRLLTPAAT